MMKRSRKLCKQAMSKYLKMITKKFLKYVKSRKLDNSGISPLREGNNVAVSDSQQKAAILIQQFTSVF